MRMRTDHEAHIRLFGTMWAIGHIAHCLRTEPFNEPLVWIVLLACALLLPKPASPYRLGFLAASQILLLYQRMPIIDNHMHLMGFVNAGILIVVVPMMWRRSSWTKRRVRVLCSYALITLVLAYGAAAFAKLNAGFFDPAGNCAVAKTYQAGESLGILPGMLPGWFEGLLPYAVTGIEFAIPVLLIFHLTRLPAVLIAVSFHIMISITPSASAIDFTVVITGLLFAALPWRMSAYVMELARAFRSRVLDPLGLDVSVFTAVVFFGLLAIIRGRFGTVDGNRAWIFTASLAMTVGPFLFWLALRSIRLGIRSEPLAQRLSIGHYVLFSLLIFNLAMPYAGVKTTGAMVMYSNLNTYDGTTNHFFVGRLPIETFHDDLVEIVETTRPRLESIRKKDHRITWHELRRIMAGHPDEPISYRRGGELYQLEAARENPELVSLDPLWHKLVAHRVHDPHNTECLW